MGSTTVPDELRQIADQRKPWVIVLTETKLTDARQDRVFFQESLPDTHCSTAVSRAMTAATVEPDLEERQQRCTNYHKPELSRAEPSQQACSQVALEDSENHNCWE